MPRKHDPTIYREVSKTLDHLFNKHGDGAAYCINRYIRIRSETRVKERRIAELEAELVDLKKIDSISRRKTS